jgi:hypothetical protein
MKLTRSVVINALMIVFAGLLLLLVGCTLVGLGLGAAVDAGRPKAGLVPEWEWTTIRPRTPIVVRLTDGTDVKGRFIRTTQLPAARYTPRFLQWRGSDSAFATLPAPGDTVAVVLRSGERLNGQLDGYDRRLVATKVTPFAWIVPAGDSIPKSINLDSTAEMRVGADAPVDVERVGSVVNSPYFPSLAAITVRTPELELIDLDIDRIDQITYPHRHGAVTGLLVGLGIDVVIIVVGVIAMSGESWGLGSGGGGSWEGGGSCPYVYSFNGERYIRDAELFTGSIFRGAQRTDWDNLDSLKGTDGQYRLRVTNERDETEFLDELQLLVVDHPMGTRIIPSFSGELFTLRNPESPVAATDFARSNVRNLVAAKDDRMWISNPFGRNPDDTSQVRDGVVVEFRKPSDADSVTLALNVQNTVWGAYLQTQFVKMFGRDVEKWYDQMNASPETCERFHQVMIREGMLLIHFWDGTAWRPAGHVWEVGPALAKDVAVRLPIAGIPGDVLRVRLESTAGLWMINSAQAAYDRGPAPVVTELQPIEARDCHGVDLRQALREADDDYYAMPTAKDWADLTFSAPPQRSGSARSFVLKSTGYYRIHTPADGEPQREVIQRLLAEPRAFGQYALRLLNEQVQLATVGIHERAK